MNGTNLPAYLQLPAGISTEFSDKLGANLGTRAQPYLSTKDDRLTLVDANGDTEPVLTRDEKTGDPYLDCVIIDACDVASKIYYGRPYEPGSDTYSPPMCWSDNGIAPSTSCSEPQAASCTPDPSGAHGCKWAVWGSGRAREGSKVVPPACSKVQKIAIMIPGDDVQFLVRVPPGSLDELAAYNAKFKGHPFSMRDVMTRISINSKTLFFRGLGIIDEATARQRNAILLAKTADALVGRGDKPRLTVLQELEQRRPLEAANSYVPNTALPPPNVLGPLLPVTQTRGTPAAAPTAPSPAAAPAVPTRRRRKFADALVEQVGDPVAPFRQAVPAAAEGGQASNGVVTNPAAPNAELEAALKGVFG